MAINFADRLTAAIQEKNSRVCVGIDPVWERLPQLLRRGLSRPDEESVLAAVRQFAHQILEAVAPWCAAAKFNSCFFENLSPGGLRLLSELVTDAQSLGLLSIVDGKRADIGSSARAYAQAAFGRYTSRSAAPTAGAGPDAVTVSPYLGSEAVQPFIEAAVSAGAGVFVLVRTSNPSATEVQDLLVRDGRAVYEHVADLVSTWGQPYIGASGYSAIGAVVGATWPQQLSQLRRLLPHTPFLVPGYGAQGAGPAQVVGAFDAQKLGAIVNSSRGIIYCSENADFAEAAAVAAQQVRDEINRALDQR